MISKLEQKIILQKILSESYIPEVKTNVGKLLKEYHKQVIEDMSMSNLIGSPVSTQAKPMIFEIGKPTEKLIEDILTAFNN